MTNLENLENGRFKLIDMFIVFCLGLLVGFTIGQNFALDGVLYTKDQETLCANNCLNGFDPAVYYRNKLNLTYGDWYLLAPHAIKPVSEVI